MTDTNGYQLDPYPTSWGISPAVMDAAVAISAELVASGTSFDDAASAAIAFINSAYAA